MEDVLTSKKIIKVLPFEAKFKEALYKQYDSLDKDQLFVVDQVLWTAYNTIFEMELQKNLELALEEVRLGKDHLDKDFYKRILEGTEGQMKDELVKSTEIFDLSTTRKQLENVLETPMSKY